MMIKINVLYILMMIKINKGDFIMINKGDFIDNFNDECVSFIMGIGNNISIYIEEVPNETAPSIQGFAKPPA